MHESIVIQKNASEGLKELLKWMLQKGKIQGVFTLIKTANNGGMCYSLVTDPDVLDEAHPLMPVMPVNAASQISKFTLDGPPEAPIAAVVRPCELRAFVELVKLSQGYPDNILFVSSTCPGVYPFEAAKNGNLEKLLSTYWETAAKAEIPDGVRSTCRACEEFIPYTADITVALMGDVDPRSEFKALLITDRARELTKGFSEEQIESDLDSDSLASVREKRGKAKEELFAEVASLSSGLSGLIDTFGKCIRCHGCMHVCPVCSCKLCYFESRETEWKPNKFETELRKRGAMRVPPGTIFYHLGRLTHMSISCVGCGQCTEVCPVDIPLSAMFMKVGESVREAFDYMPGRDFDEAIPLTTFKRDEFMDVGES